jgi:hypothetical protein
VAQVSCRMSDDLNERVGVLTRREIEARILAPILARLTEELGAERAEALLRDVVEREAMQVGARMRETAAREGDADDLRSFAAQWEPWFRGGALEIETLEATPDTWRFDVTRCRYAEMYRALGLERYGAMLSCRRDAALIGGYSDTVRFERTQTIMEGAATCDFHYRRVRPADEDEGGVADA